MTKHGFSALALRGGAFRYPTTLLLWRLWRLGLALKPTAVFLVIVAALWLVVPAWGLEVDLDSNNAVDVEFGGTNAITEAGARTSLGVAPNTGHYLTDQAESELSAEVVVTANGKSLVTAADYAAMRVLLGVGSYIQAWDADLDTYAGITPSANVQSLLGAADYAAMRVLLTLTIGTDVQAWDADLDTYAGITPSTDVQAILAAADYAAILDLLDLETADLLAALQVDDLVTLSGVAAGAQSLGAFTGSTITDNLTIKEAFQSLETALETTTGDIQSVLDDTSGAVPVLYQGATAFVDADATPDISAHSVFVTANTGATTITDFDWGGGSAVNGTIIWVIVNDANTTFDFTSSGLEGSAADYTASDGEVLQFIYTTVDNQWHFLGFPKVLSNVTIGGGTASRAASWDASGNLISAAYASSVLINTLSDETGTGAAVFGTSPTIATPVMTTQEVDGHATGSLTAAQVSNSVVYNTGQGAGDVTLSLPTAAAGYAFIATVGTTVAANKWRVRADTNDKIYRYGTNGSVNAGADNGYVGYSGAGAYPTIGHSFACFTFKTDAYDWICKPCTNVELTAE